MKRRRAPLPKLRALEIPIPVPVTAESLLSSRLGPRRADLAVSRVEAELGLSKSAPRSVLAAVAFARLGGDLGLAAKSLSWSDFEEFCAMVVEASGYGVRRNVRLTKPTRQIDIVAESGSLVLAIDCKHWQRGSGPGALAPAAVAQAERTRLLMEKALSSGGRAYLPVLLTVLDNQVRIIDGIPVVPLHGLRDFLLSVNRFDGRLSFVAG